MQSTREQLADYAHEAWAGWMAYLYGRCVERTRAAAQRDPDDLVIPGEWVRRWRRQMETPYPKLLPNEQESDREEADKILAIVEAR